MKILNRFSITFNNFCFTLLVISNVAYSYTSANEIEESIQPFSDSIAVPDTKSAANSSEPIKHPDGRIRYIVDLVDDNTGRPDKFTDADSYVAYTKDKSAKLIEDVSKLKGVELFTTTSGLVGTSFTAYLTEKQLEQFSKDKRVKLITQDAYIQSSAIWNPATDASGQVRPWGLQAMSVSNAGSSNGGATVYVLDYGVELHPDLTGLSAANRLTAIPGVNATGCYSHATHVAGIIGAADNGGGVVGVLPGVRLVSIGLGSVNTVQNGISCASATSVAISTLTSALQKASEFLYQSNGQNVKVGIINLSFNGAGFFTSSGTIGQKMLSVSTPFTIPGVQYKGALIVQSAGNNYSNACNVAYDAPSPGIIVVGGLDDNGQSVVPLNGQNAYVNQPLGGDEPGSNTGGCIGVWAPSQRVLSTWSNGTYAYLSGTSMAAPHIAGFAARLLESNSSLTTPASLKAALVSYAITISGSNLTIPRLSLQAATAAPTVGIAEGSGLSAMVPVYFNKLAAGVNLRYQALGASGSCLVSVARNGAAYSSGYFATTYNLGANLLPPGQYTWSVTCTSPQGTQTTTVASGLIKRPITLNWFVNTTSTSGVFQALANGATVTWSASANASFSQYYNATGADTCRIRSSGFTGNSFADQLDNPNFSPFASPVFTPTLLWDSGATYPAYFNFGSFNFGNPNTAAPPFGPYNGYKWLLTCTNTDGISNATVMYGTSQP